MQLEKRKTKRIYFIAPAPVGISPGQRFRFEHYLTYCKDYGLDYTVSPFYNMAGWMALFVPGKTLKKIALVGRGIGIRIMDLFKIGRYDFVYIFREAAPVGPPVFEFIIKKILRKKIIYDFDDAIWIPASSEYNKIAYYFKWFSKIGSICKWSHIVSTGNKYLSEFALRYNRNVVVIPTVVDTEWVHNQTQDQSVSRPVIGWTGTFSTLKYLEIVLPVLRRLQEKHEFTFVVIADKDPVLPLKDYRFIRWDKKTEVRDLLSMHIGLMPLYDDAFSKGKCGFKAIQYMALGIPSLVSPVGVNSVIVDDGINGFVCDSEEDWENKLSLLLEDAALRNRMAAESKKKIINNYSVKATTSQFMDLFN